MYDPYMEKFSKKSLKIISLIILIIAVVIVVIGLPFQWNKPKPQIILKTSSAKVEKGKAIKITMILKNIGGASLGQNTAHGGLHIEVKNADV